MGSSGTVRELGSTAQSTTSMLCTAAKYTSAVIFVQLILQEREVISPVVLSYTFVQ